MGQYSGQYGYVSEAKWIKTRTLMWTLAYGMGVLAILSAGLFVILGIMIHPGMFAALIASVILGVISGMSYADQAVSYHAERIARAEDRAEEKERRARKEETERFDALCKPWNVILRDPESSKEQKDLARTILADLTLGHK